MKLEKIDYLDITNDELRKKAQEFIEEYIMNFDEVINEFGDGKIRVVEVYVAYDPTDNTIFDVEIFDPYHHFTTSSGEALYTDCSGYVGWIAGWEDPEGNDADTVFDEYDGVPQGI